MLKEALWQHYQATSQIAHCRRALFRLMNGIPRIILIIWLKIRLDITLTIVILINLNINIKI